MKFPTFYILNNSYLFSKSLSIYSSITRTRIGVSVAITEDIVARTLATFSVYTTNYKLITLSCVNSYTQECTDVERILIGERCAHVLRRTYRNADPYGYMARWLGQEKPKGGTCSCADRVCSAATSLNLLCTTPNAMMVVVDSRAHAVTYVSNWWLYVLYVPRAIAQVYV